MVKPSVNMLGPPQSGLYTLSPTYIQHWVFPQQHPAIPTLFYIPGLCHLTCRTDSHTRLAQSRLFPVCIPSLTQKLSLLHIFTGSQWESGAVNVAVLRPVPLRGTNTPYPIRSMGTFQYAPLSRQIPHHAGPNISTGAYGNHCQLSIPIWGKTRWQLSTCWINKMSR